MKVGSRAFAEEGTEIKDLAIRVELRSLYQQTLMG